MSWPHKVSGASRPSATRFRRLRLLVILLGVFVLLAFAAASAYDVWRSYRHMVTATNREISNLAHALSEQTAWTWQAIDLLLLDTARWYRDDAHNIPDRDIDSVLAARTVGAQVRLVTVVDAQGIERHRSQGATPPNLDISDRDHFIAQRDHADIGLFMSQPVVARSTSRNSVVFTRRMEDQQGQFAGIVAAIVDLEDLQKFYSAVNLGLGTSTYLLRDDGTLLLRNPLARNQTGQKFPALAAATNAPAIGFLNPVDGKDEFVAVARVRNTPLQVAVTRDRQLGLRPWRAEATSVAIRTLVLTLLGTLTIVVC